MAISQNRSIGPAAALALVPDEPAPISRARGLAEDFAKRAAVHDAQEAFPTRNFDDLRGTGLLALTVPARIGGGGRGLREAREIVGAIAEGDPATALILAMQYVHHVTIASSPSWPRHLAERLQRGAIEDGSLVNALRVEPELGSPARGGLPATIARHQGNGWSIEGRKIYSTGGAGLTWSLVWARTDEDEPRLGPFLVPMNAQGLRIEKTWDATGMRASASDDVVLEGVFVPADHAVDLRAPRAWAAVDPVQMAWNTTLISAVYDGVARAAQAWLRTFLHERVPSNLGASLATLPRFQDAVGENERLLFVSSNLLATAAAAVDAGQPFGAAESGLLKLTVTENAIAIVQRAAELAGNRGLSRKSPLERHLRDVLCARIHTPQGDSIRLAAGRLSLDLS